MVEYFGKQTAENFFTCFVKTFGGTDCLYELNDLEEEARGVE